MDFKHPQNLIIIASLCNLAGLLLLWAAIKKPVLARLLFFLLFGWACWINYKTSHQHPEFYLEYVRKSIPLYRDFINGWFSRHITVFVSTIAIGQGLIALGMLLRGIYVKLACTGAVIFLLCIAPLGINAAFPFPLIVAAAAYFIARKGNLSYSWRPSGKRVAIRGKKILLLNGNTGQESFSQSICMAYREAAEKAGHSLKVFEIGGMQFDPVLQEGYHAVQPLEPHLQQFREAVMEAEHLVIVYPTWWAGLPAKLKGLFDRSFLPGFAFLSHEKDPLWDKLLKGRSAHIITTMDAPVWWYRIMYRSAGTNMLKRGILHYCGISPVRTTIIGQMKNKQRAALSKELEKIKKIAAGLK